MPSKRKSDGPPFEGVPSWMKASLAQWMAPIVRGDEASSSVYGDPHRLEPEPFAMQAQRNLHLTLDWSYGTDSANESLLHQMDEDDDVFLRVIEFALSRIEQGYIGVRASNAVDQLETILREGGSVWEVDRSSYPPSLHRRVTAAAGAAIEVAKTSAGHAGELLVEAWDKAFGRHPDPSTAYGKAIKAVEAAAAPIVLPNDPLATLGKIVPALRAKPSKWQTPFTRSTRIEDASGQSQDLDGVLVLASQMDLLWRNQTDRHGTPNPQRIEQHQAEAAVHQAVALVHLLIGGGLTVGP
jgi:hypothetical protein